MCELCQTGEAIQQLPEPAVEAEVSQSRLQSGVAAMSIMAVEGARMAPVAEMAAVCGCGACGLCRMTFIGATASQAFRGIKQGFANLRSRFGSAE